MDLVVPVLGESTHEASIGKWLKNVGDAVVVGESFIELETDYVSLELPAPSSGVITAQRAKRGAKVSAGAVIGVLDPGRKVA